MVVVVIGVGVGTGVIVGTGLADGLEPAEVCTVVSCARRPATAKTKV